MDCDITVPRLRHMLFRHAAGLDAQLPVEVPDASFDTSTRRWTTLDETRCLLCLVAALRSPEQDARARAARAAAQILAHSEPLGRHVAPVVARVTQALLSDDAGRWQLLDRALSLAAGRRYVRPLVEIGAPLRPLLQAALGQPLSAPARAQARLLLDRLATGVPAGTSAAGLAGIAASSALPQTSALTDREQEVLAHLCRGLSNKAIAHTMYVSPETVKTHLKHIYDKLEVARRREAVQRAHALGLVPRPGLDA
jgi:LuxR family transcriptional regulator, maltose regulon positive regulatory protein